MMILRMTLQSLLVNTTVYTPGGVDLSSMSSVAVPLTLMSVFWYIVACVQRWDTLKVFMDDLE